jgi:hypothetical protein
LPYEPAVREYVKPTTAQRDDYTVSVANAVALPLGEDASLASWPSLVVLDRQLEGSLVVDAQNRDLREHSFQATVAGAVRGDGWTPIRGGETGFLVLKLRPDRNGPDSRAPDGALLRGTLEVKANKAQTVAPLEVVSVGRASDAPPAHYRFDFDRDGSDEWVLENRSLRLVLSPAAGGEAVALAEMTSNFNLFTTVGALRDAVASPEAASSAARLEDMRQTYSAEWLNAGGEPAVRMRYHGAGAAADGVTIEKTVRLVGENTVEVGYRFAVDAPVQRGRTAPAGKALIVTSSVPAATRNQRVTQFCWEPPPPQQDPTQAKQGKSAPEQCAPFTPSGAAMGFPAGVRRIEVHTEGEPGLALAWSQGTLIIVPKNYSAELRLRLPAAPNGAPVTATLRYTMLPTD